MGCIFPENKLEVLQIRGRECGGVVLVGRRTPQSFLIFFWGGGIMWVQEWVAGFGIRGPHQPASVVAPQLPGKQVSSPCEPHTSHR